jgi:hypothetical protein
MVTTNRKLTRALGMTSAEERENVGEDLMAILKVSRFLY